MSKKPIKFPGVQKSTMKEKIIDKLRLKYPRLERNTEEVETIPPEEKQYYPAQSLKRRKVIRLSKTLAEEGYIKWGDAGLDFFIGDCLAQVIYRSLKAVYGFPDILTNEVIEEEVFLNESIHAKTLPIEWGYLLQGKDGSCLEILRRIRDGFPNIILWLPYEERPVEMPRGVKGGFSEFLSLFEQLVKILDHEYSIKEEQKKARQAFGSEILRGVTNLYLQNFQAGKDMIGLGEKWLPELEEVHRNLFSSGQWAEAANVFRKGSILYVSATVFFLMALEGFVNLLYKFLLKSKYAYEEYERAIWKADFDLRILHLPVYCKGFSSADFAPDDVLYRKWKEIRPFRNNLLHSNVTEENESITTFEDCFLFYYNPLFHLKNKHREKLHTGQLHMDKKSALQVQEIVEQIVSEIIEKMDEKEKAWVKSWIDKLIVSWVPGIEDREYALSLHTDV